MISKSFSPIKWVTECSFCLYLASWFQYAACFVMWGLSLASIICMLFHVVFKSSGYIDVLSLFQNRWGANPDQKLLLSLHWSLSSDDWRLVVKLSGKLGFKETIAFVTEQDNVQHMPSDSAFRGQFRQLLGEDKLRGLNGNGNEYIRLYRDVCIDASVY